MVAMAALCGTRIRYTRPLFHLVGDDPAAGVEEGGDSSGRRFHRVVDLVQSTCVLDLVQSTCVLGLVLQFSDQFKGSMATTLSLGRWSLGARARRLPDCHQQWHAGSGNGAATTARRRLVRAPAMVVRLSTDLDLIFIMVEVFCIYDELYEGNMP